MFEDHLFCGVCGKRVERPPSTLTRGGSKPGEVSPSPPAKGSSKVPAKVASATSPKVESTAPLKVESTTLPKESGKETVLAGLSSADMARPGSLGYGIYITDRRIIGVKKPEQFAKMVGGAIAGAVIGKLIGFEAPWAVSSALGRNLSSDDNLHLLSELEKNKDFEVYIRDITLVQLKEAGIINPGQLAFFVGGAKTTDIAISLRNDKVVDSLKDMLKVHFPQVLKIVV
jgi:hypothetical protein